MVAVLIPHHATDIGIHSLHQKRCKISNISGVPITEVQKSLLFGILGGHRKKVRDIKQRNNQQMSGHNKLHTICTYHLFLIIDDDIINKDEDDPMTSEEL